MIKYLIELKKRLIFCILSTAIIFLLLFYYSEYTYLVLNKLSNNNNVKLIATKVTSPFMVPIKLSFILSIFINIPVIIYNIWSFIKPALYINEKKLFRIFVISSCLLFYIGVTFSYFILCPIAFNFFNNIYLPGVSIMMDINNHLDFVLSLLISGGIAFQIPIITLILLKIKIVSINYLSQKRPYIIVLSFILAMLLTPPDVISQVLLAIPMCLLFEIGIFLYKIYDKDKTLVR